MDIRTLLTVTGPKHGNDDLALVADLASGIGAHLSVFVVALAAPPPAGEFGMVAPEAWLAQRQSDVDDLDDRIAAVTAWLAERGVPGDVTSDYPELGRADEVIGRRARYADLTIVGPGMLAHPTLREKTIEGALFSSGRPLLVVPRNAVPTLTPKRVMVAWDHRVEASRAAREALALVKSADDVRLVLVDPSEGETTHGAEPGADAAAWLARHGAKVTIDRIPRGGSGIAGTLSRHAVDCGAELIVMGAYGHSRLRERIFGGVTRSMLESAPVPILLAH